MKKSSRGLTLLLVVVFMFSFTIQPAFAATHTNTSYKLFANEESETVYIDGASYTYRYYYENGNRAIDIVNNETGNTDKLVYDEAASVMHLNENQFPIVDCITSTSALTYTNGWESMGTSSYYISWGTATTAAVVAGMIAIYLGSLGTAGVIAAMGVGALGVIAANSSGGTLTTELQELNIPFTTPQYRYIWSFIASTGDTYGPYISHVTV